MTDEEIKKSIIKLSEEIGKVGGHPSLDNIYLEDGNGNITPVRDWLDSKPQEPAAQERAHQGSGPDSASSERR